MELRQSSTQTRAASLRVTTIQIFSNGEAIRQSMDGKARWVDNVIIERWFRSLKCDNIYITEYTSPRELRKGILDYVNQYNYERPHSEHGGDYPSEAYFAFKAA